MIALPRVPAGLAAEYPDLLVRCNDHGDVVVDRVAVLGQIERPPPSGKVKVDVSPPHREYAEPRDDLWPPEMPEPGPMRWSQRRRYALRNTPGLSRGPRCRVTLYQTRPPLSAS
jgi:hypothetical protein